MTIFAGELRKRDQVGTGVVVPSATVWMNEKPRHIAGKVRHVRTLDCSNRDRFAKPEGLRVRSHPVQNRVQPIREDKRTMINRNDVGHPNTRSIIETVKQWAGGGLFGLVIFAGVLLSQSGEEEVAPSFSEAHMVGVNLGE